MQRIVAYICISTRKISFRRKLIHEFLSSERKENMVSFKDSVPQHAPVLNNIAVTTFPHTEQIGKSWSARVLPRMMSIEREEIKRGVFGAHFSESHIVFYSPI